MLLPLGYEYIIIGDVHACIDELKSLLIKQGFLITDNLLEVTPQSENKSIILLGDFVDKGNDGKLTQTIEFIYANYYHLNQERQRFYLIEGNHENMVYRYITNDDTLLITPKTIANKKKYYNTVALLEKTPPLKKLFLELYEELHPYLYYHYDENFSVTLSHAPCEVQYLRLNSPEGKKKMIKSISRSKNPTMPLDELMPYLLQEAVDNEHYHIFGHLSQANIRRYKNKICVDTSAIYGVELSCAIVKNNQLTFDSVPFENKQKKGTQDSNTLFDF